MWLSVCLAGCATVPGVVTDTAGGRTVEHALAGQGAPVVVFENGLGASLDWWAKVWPDTVQETTALAYNRAGYGQLCELLTRAYLDNKHRGRAEMRREWFENGAAADLLCLSGAMSGDIGAAIAAGNLEQAAQLAADWARLFPDAFYIEIQRAGHPGTEGYIRHAVDIASRLGLPVVATHPVQFLKREDFKAHEARVCIAQGYVLADKRRPRDFTEEQYLKSQAEMCELFADLPEALENAVEIARRCSFVLDTRKPILPRFTGGSDDPEVMLGVLEVVLCHHRIARGLGIPRQLQVLFRDVGGIAPHFHVRPVALEIARERIDVLAPAIVVAAAGAVLVTLVWSHRFLSKPWTETHGWRRAIWHTRPDSGATTREAAERVVRSAACKSGPSWYPAMRQVAVLLCG